MRRVIALELVGLKELGCDLYDENGNIIYQKRTVFTPEILMMLHHSIIFKRDEEPLIPEKTEEFRAFKDFKIPESMPLQEKVEFHSKIDEKKKEQLITGIKGVLYSVIHKTPLEIQTCVDATEAILDEVYNKLSKVNNFNELRINDYYTFSHSINVAILSAIIGREVGFNDNKVKDLTFSAFLHDVGKMRIPRNILYKPESLTIEEMQLVKEHSQIGYDFITKELKLPYQVATAALEHHERWEGQGYPQGLKGNQISEFAQIVAIADVFDALISEKIYRGPIPAIEAIRVLLTEESKSFNPQIINKFVYMAIIKSENGASLLID